VRVTGSGGEVREEPLEVFVGVSVDERHPTVKRPGAGHVRSAEAKECSKQGSTVATVPAKVRIRDESGKGAVNILDGQVENARDSHISADTEEAPAAAALPATFIRCCLSQGLPALAPEGFFIRQFQCCH